MRLKKTVQRSVNSAEDLRFSITVMLSNWREVLHSCRPYHSGTLECRQAEIMVNIKITSEELDRLVAEILEDCKAEGVSYYFSRSKSNRPVVVLENNLIGDRIYYYTVDVKGDRVHVRSVTVDLQKGKPLQYGVNMFQTKEAAEIAAEKIMKLLGGVEQ